MQIFLWYYYCLVTELSLLNLFHLQSVSLNSFGYSLRRAEIPVALCYICLGTFSDKCISSQNQCEILVFYEANFVLVIRCIASGESKDVGIFSSLSLKSLSTGFKTDFSAWCINAWCIKALWFSYLCVYTHNTHIYTHIYICM